MCESYYTPFDLMHNLLDSVSSQGWKMSDFYLNLNHFYRLNGDRKAVVFFFREKEVMLFFFFFKLALFSAEDTVPKSALK